MAQKGSARKRTTHTSGVRESRRSRRKQSSGASSNRFDEYMQRWRQSRLNPGRTFVIVLMSFVLAISLATPLRTYYRQQTEKDALIKQNEQLMKDIARKEQRLAIQNDPRTIEEQARLRLLLIPRGETGFRIVLPGKEEQSKQEQVDKRESLTLHGGGPWYRDLWRSFSVPDPNKQATP